MGAFSVYIFFYSLQVPKKRQGSVDIPPPLPVLCPQGMTQGSRLRSNGQSPLSLRTPVKAVTPVGSMATGRTSCRGLPVVTASGGGRRVQSPGTTNGGAYVPGRASTGAARAGMGRGQSVSSASTRSKLSQPPRR